MTASPGITFGAQQLRYNDREGDKDILSSGGLLIDAARQAVRKVAGNRVQGSLLAPTMR